MKKLIYTIVAVFASALMAGGNLTPIAPVTTPAGVYVGVGLGSAWTYTKGDFDLTDDVAGKSNIDPAIGIKVGAEFVRWDSVGLGAEGRLIASFNSDDFDTTVYSLFVKPEYYFGTNDEFGLYALAGYSYVRYNAGSATDHKGGFAGGLGLDYKLTDNVVVSVDWVSNLWNKEVGGKKDLNNDAAMLWVSYQF